MKAFYHLFIALAAVAALVSCKQKPMELELPESMVKLPGGTILKIHDTEHHDVFARFNEATVRGTLVYMGEMDFLPADYSENVSVVLSYGTESRNLTQNVPCTLGEPVADKWKTTVPFTAELSGLKDGTDYFFKTTATYGEEPSIVNAESSFFTFPEGPVDLDLPSGNLWASLNLGAGDVIDAGNLYAWAETTTRKPGFPYDWTTYKWVHWATGSEFGLIKYCNFYLSGDNGFTDDKTVIESSDDAAAQNLGDGWHIPTNRDWTELNDYCDWTPESVGGMNGWIVRSKFNTSDNNKVIFIPCSGYMNGTEMLDACLTGYYWSSELYSSANFMAYHFELGTEDNHELSKSLGRCYGMPIRPVKGK